MDVEDGLTAETGATVPGDTQAAEETTAAGPMTACPARAGRCNDS